MSGHTKRSPSQSKRFLACAGTFAICDTLPDHHRNQSTLAAQLGTATHGLIERSLRENVNPADFEGRIIELIGDEETVQILRPGAKVPGPGRVFFEVDSDMISGAEMMTTYVRERCDHLGVKYSDLQLETRTNPLPDRDDASGTADVTIDAWPTVLEVIDYKNGYLTVEHEDNEQALSYLLGKAIETKFSHEEYITTIVQPNGPHEEGRKRSFHTTKKELLAFQKRLRAGIERCEEAEREHAEALDSGPHEDLALSDWADKWLVAGDHCTFCDAQAICPARAKLAESSALVEFKEDPREIELRADYEQATRILAWAPMLDSLIKAAHLFVERGLMAGDTVPGWKLVRGRSTRKLRNDMSEGTLVKRLVTGGFVPDREDLYLPAKLKSGPQIEKLITAKRRKEFNNKFLVKPEGRLTVAPEGDPREAIDYSIGDDFKDENDFDFG